MLTRREQNHAPAHLPVVMFSCPCFDQEQSAAHIHRQVPVDLRRRQIFQRLRPFVVGVISDKNVERSDGTRRGSDQAFRCLGDARIGFVRADGISRKPRMATDSCAHLCQPDGYGIPDAAAPGHSRHSFSILGPFLPIYPAARKSRMGAGMGIV